MNTNRLALVSVIVGLAVPAPAVLQFTNINTGTGVSSSLTAAACDGNSTFVSVGANSTALAGTYNTSLQVLRWTKSSVPGTISLLSVAYGAGKFLAGGPNATAFASTDNGTSWTAATSPFPNTASVEALGFNNGTFVAAGSAVEIFYAGTALNPWTSATLPSTSFLESFRSVTPLGANGFAVCGILDTVRISSDGGQSWPVSRALNISNPDLYGIAAGSGQSLVAVGAGARILFSSDGGAHWSLPSSGVANNLNAVAFGGPNLTVFLAAGNGGTIPTSPDGSAWTSVSGVVPANANLHGATFATGGNLQGVGLLVGDSGTVVLVGTPPTAPVTNAVSSQTNCSFSLPNPSLSVAVVTDGAHPAGTVGVDWYDAASGGTRVWTNSTGFSPPGTNVPPNASTNYFYYAEARDLRTGFTSTNRTPVCLLLQDCANSLSISPDNKTRTNVILRWLGNVGLESAPRLTNPVPWTPVATGQAGILNCATNPATASERFFRLFAPTR